MYEKFFALSIDLDKSTVELIWEDENEFDFTEVYLVEKNATTTKVRIINYNYDVSSLDLSRDGVFLQITSELKSANEAAMTIATGAKIK